MHEVIRIRSFSLAFPHKICFEDFSADINFGDRIAIIGRNGSGKTSLLKMIANQNSNISLAHISQIIDGFDSLSGGEKFNKNLSKVLGENPSILLLDEPTNHLDCDNRRSLMRMLNSYYGTIIAVTHDEELLRNFDILWHIDNGKITIFHGKYEDYMKDLHLQRQSIFHQMQMLKREKKSQHDRLMNEQEKVSKSRVAGEKKIQNKKWMKSTADLKTMKAEKSQGKNLKNIEQKKQKLSQQLQEMSFFEEIIPKFSISFRKSADQNIVTIAYGAIGYDYKIIAKNINISLASAEHLAIIGKNGSGKTTLIKAIMGDKSIRKNGDWYCPHADDIGYLDQHYKDLDPEKTAIETIEEINPSWTQAEIRKHLNDFLFRKNEEVMTKVCNLSGSEKARLSLAKIAARIPKLLILDEITNNIDLETKNHITDILKNYPSAMIVISHDQIFLDKIKIDEYYELHKNSSN